MKGNLKASILIVPAAKIAAAALSFITNVMIIRSLGAEDFGIYITCVTIILIVSGVVGHSLDAGILKLIPPILSTDNKKSLLIFKVVFKLKMLGALLLIALIVPLGFFFGDDLLHYAQPSELVFLISLGILGVLLIGSSLIYLQTHELFAKYLTLDVLLVVVKLALVGLFIYTSMLTIKSALAVYAILPLLLFVCSFFIVPRDYFHVSGNEKVIVDEVIHFSKWIVISVVLQTLYAKLDLLMVNVLDSPSETGIYAAAFNLAAIPELLASFLLVVFYPKIMILKKNGEFLHFLIKFTKYTLPVCVVGVAAGLFLAKPVIHLLYTSQYDASVLVFQILLPGTAFWLLVLPLASPYLTLSKPRLLVIFEIGALIVIFVLNLLLIPMYGAVGAAIATLISRVVMGASILIYVATDAARHSSPQPEATESVS